MKKFNFRRSDNGQYTTENYAIKHPKTTVRESTKESLIKSQQPSKKK